LSFDDARTLFHEFGHALHGMLSNVTYPLLAGTAVPSDFVELPSQLYEHWLETPEILRDYARHCRTGEPMPQALLDRLLATRTYGQGFATVEYTSCALVDLDIHALPDGSTLDVSEFERSDLERIHMPAEIVMRHRLPHFQHLFSGGGYAAGYYSYMWSEVLDADAFEAFTETGDAFDPATGALGSKMLYAQQTNETGRPDGATVDTDGNYWSAGVSAGLLNCFAPDGNLLEAIRMPVDKPTMPCFCGPELDQLVVTSIRQPADPAASEPDTLSGGLFLVEGHGRKGTKTYRFRTASA